LEEKKYPKILVGGPVTEFKLGPMPQFIANLKKFTYPNMTVVFTDNSPTDSLREAMKPFKGNFPLHIIPTKYRAYVRERLVEGRNLLRAIMLKQKDLSAFELTPEYEKLVRELQKEDFDYFFSLEQDVLPPVDVLERLLSCDKDIVQGVYFNQKRDDQTNTTKIIPMAWTWGDPEIKEVEFLRDMTMDHLLPSKVQQIAASGVGCVLMKKEVLANMRENVYEHVTSDKIEEIKNSCLGGDLTIEKKDHNTTIKTRGFRYVQNKYACDDMFFSLDTTSAGYEIFMDSYIWCQHFHQQWDLQQVGER